MAFEKGLEAGLTSGGLTPAEYGSAFAGIFAPQVVYAKSQVGQVHDGGSEVWRAIGGQRKDDQQKLTDMSLLNSKEYAKQRDASRANTREIAETAHASAMISYSKAGFSYEDSRDKANAAAKSAMQVQQDVHDLRFTRADDAVRLNKQATEKLALRNKAPP
jgi:hypothetical protein